ncbi:hypothetical protein CASFOL_014580 [Castilleja foliolosa]|uniref:Uncharacterized protein n=1 Tax=Castilleja foliolosa TaxID=1961234 RepID=A0ABD3DSE6_9LAMI
MSLPSSPPGTPPPPRRRPPPLSIRRVLLGNGHGFEWFLPLVSLGLLRYMSASSNIIHDCDEVFNYWEPLRFLLYKVFHVIYSALTMALDSWLEAMGNMRLHPPTMSSQMILRGSGSLMKHPLLGPTLVSGLVFRSFILVVFLDNFLSLLANLIT